MNILFVKNYNALRRLIPVGQSHQHKLPIAACLQLAPRYKHDQQQQNPKLSESINKNNDLTTTTETVQSVINSRRECLEKLRLLSDRFYVELRQVRARTSDYEERQLELRSRTHEPSMAVQRRYVRSPLTQSIVSYVAAQDDLSSAFSVREKAVMFKMLAMIHSCHADKSTYTDVLDKLERDFYNEIASEQQQQQEGDIKSSSKFSFIDLINYRDAFFYHRANHPPFHFFTQSLDKMCRLILKSVEKDSTFELIPSKQQQQQQQQGQEGESAVVEETATAVDAINQKWLLDHVYNEPVTLIGYFLRDTAILTRDMLSMLFTFLLRNQYRVFTDSRPITLNHKLHPEAKVNALVTLLAVYFRARIPGVLNRETREFYQQLLQNTWKRTLDEFHLVRNTYARFYYLQMLANWIKIEPDSPVYKKLSETFFREIMNANDPRSLTLSVRCLFELRYRQQEYKRDQKNVPISTYFVQCPIYSKLARGFADDKCAEINLREKEARSQTSPIEKEHFLTLADQSMIIERVGHVIESPVQFYDFVVLNRNEFFKSLGRHNARKFMDMFNSITESWLRSIYSGGGELNEDTLAKLCFGASIRLRTSMKEFKLSNRILEYFDNYFLNSNKEFADISKGQLLSLILAHRDFVNKRHMLEIKKLVNENVLDAPPVVRQLANDADFYLERTSEHARATEDVFLQAFDNTSRILMEYKWQPLLGKDNDEHFSEQIKVATDIINQLFKIRSKIRFNSIGLNIRDLLTNMNNSIAWLNENSSLASQKDREAIITGYGRCIQSLAHMAMLSNVYNKELIGDLLAGSVRLLTAVEEHLPEFERIERVRECVVGLLTVGGVFDFFDFRSLERGGDDSSVAKARWPLVVQDLARLRKLNESMYERTRLGNDAHTARSLLDLVHYNFGLLNLDIQFNSAINDMFSNIESVEHFLHKFAYLNDERIELLTKFVYAMNQSLCIKHRENNLIWHFDGYNPLLPFSKGYQNIRQVLATLVKNDKNIIEHPMYEYGLVADFEILFDDENSSRKSSSHRVPIMVFDKSYYYENLNELKRPIATYVRNFRQLYPLVILNNDIMSKLQPEEKTKYVHRNIMKSLSKI